MDEHYVITLKGLLTDKIPENYIDQMQDAIELHMRRHNLNAMILDGGVFTFVEVERRDE